MSHPDGLETVAFQGVPGAFSDAAARALAPGFTPTPFASFADVFAAVTDGRCARAVVPMENSLAGPVPEVAALLPKSDLVVLAEAWRPIRLALMAVSGATLEGLRTVESHPMALKQCRRLTGEFGLEPREAFDTAGAAAEIAQARDPARAAVASPLAAELYGLTVLREGVEDAPDNRTRFLLLARP